MGEPEAHEVADTNSPTPKVGVPISSLCLGQIERAFDTVGTMGFDRVPLGCCDIDGVSLGAADCTRLGITESDGESEGLSDGTVLGSAESEGISDGFDEGDDVGEPVGDSVSPQRY